MIGTPAYMSSEQLVIETVTYSADAYLCKPVVERWQSEHWRSSTGATAELEKRSS